jgi:hypothetical protein
MKNPELSPGGSSTAGEPGVVTERHRIRVKCAMLLNITVFRQCIQGISVSVRPLMITHRFKPKPQGSRFPGEHSPLFSLMRLALFKAFTPSILITTLLLSGCSGTPYQPRIEDMASVKARSESQTIGNIRVSVAVPGPEEAEAIFNLPLYDRGIHPAWIEVVDWRNRAAD